MGMKKIEEYLNTLKIRYTKVEKENESVDVYICISRLSEIELPFFLKIDRENKILSIYSTNIYTIKNTDDELKILKIINQNNSLRLYSNSYIVKKHVISYFGSSLEPNNELPDFSQFVDYLVDFNRNIYNLKSMLKGGF